MIDCPGTQDGSSLRSLIDKPPVCGNSFSPLTGALLTGFRLHTGPVHITQSITVLQYMHTCATYWHWSVNLLTVECTHLISHHIFTATRTVQTDAHTASEEEEQTQAQASPTAGSITTRYDINCLHTCLQRGWSQFTNLFLFDVTETPSDSDPKKKKKKRDDDPDRKKKKKDKKKKKVITNSSEALINSVIIHAEPFLFIVVYCKKMFNTVFTPRESISCETSFQKTTRIYYYFTTYFSTLPFVLAL